MRNFFGWLLTTALILSPFAAFAAAPDPGTVLPYPTPPFTGHIGRTFADSKPAWPPTVKAPKGAPNVLLILTDDIGFGASGTFGGPIPTPTLNQLAANGLRYNRFHTTAMCSPTRAALLTGRNHHDVGAGTVADLATGYPGYDAIMPRSAATIAEILRLNGYNTAMFGKHHNVPYAQTSPAGPFNLWPTRLGFQYFYGFLGGDTDQFDPKLYLDTAPVDGSHRPPGYILDRDLADHAIRWIHNQKANAPNKPFFIYYAPGSAHAPHQAPKAWIKKFEGKFNQGWDKLREQTYRRQKSEGIIPASADLTPRPPEIPSWNSQTPLQKRVESRMMAVFAAEVAYQDHEIGRIIHELKRMGQLKNTLVIFIEGDNGGSAEGGIHGTTNELGFMANGMKENAKKIDRVLDTLGGPKTYELYPVGWAWATDTPFQWTKQIASHLGGTRNGMVISWPDGIHSRGMRSQYSHVIDIMPTILQAIGLPVPKVVDGVKQKRVDGISLVYSFNHPDAPSRRKTQYYEMLGNRAIYHDGWLANTTPPRGPWQEKGKLTPVLDYHWELYDLAHDYSQANNVAADYPKRLAAMRQLWWKEARRNQVLPLDNRNGPARAMQGHPPLNFRQKHFVFWGGGISVARNLAPMLAMHSFTITADITVPKQPASGAIVAYGSWFGGWSFYLHNGRLAATEATAQYADDQYTVEAPHALPPGPATVTLAFDANARRPYAGGTMHLSVNGTEVASGPVARTIMIPAGLGETFDIGADTGVPVTSAYPKGGKFGGDISKVEVDLRWPQKPPTAAKPKPKAAPAQR